MVHRAPNILTQRDKKVHARGRRLLSYGFSESALRSYEDPVNNQVIPFCDYLVTSDEDAPVKAPSSEGWSPPRNMADWCKLFRWAVFIFDTLV